MLRLYLFDFYTRILGLSPILAALAFTRVLPVPTVALSDLLVSAGLFATRSKASLACLPLVRCGAPSVDDRVAFFARSK